MAVLSAGSYTYLSYALYKTLHHPRAEIYGLAAVCTICMVPFTSIVMGSNIGKLEEKAKESQEWSIADEKVENRAAKGNLQRSYSTTGPRSMLWGSLSISRRRVWRLGYTEMNQHLG